MLLIESSAIEGLDYEPKQHRLTVTFAGGATYAYAEVPPSIWDALLAAESRGRFVNLEIKPHYDAARLTSQSGFAPRSAA